MAKELSITYRQGNIILNASAVLRMVAELGRGDTAEKFDDVERVYIDELIVKARKFLMSFTIRVRETKEILFGDIENWRPTVNPETQKKMHELVDPDLKLKLKPDDEQREGLYWILLLMAHPSSPTAVMAQVLEEVVWPVAKELGCEKQLAKHLKLDQKKGRKISWDDDKAWDTAKKPRLLEDEPAKEPEKKATGSK